MNDVTPKSGGAVDTRADLMSISEHNLRKDSCMKQTSAGQM